MSIRCLFGFHRWRKMRDDEGQWYARCERCDKYRDVAIGGAFMKRF